MLDKVGGRWNRIADGNMNGLIDNQQVEQISRVLRRECMVIWRATAWIGREVGGTRESDGRGGKWRGGRTGMGRGEGE